MINWIKSLFKSEEKVPPLEKQYEQILIATVRTLLSKYPHKFSAKWSTGDRIDNSVMHQNGKITVMIYNGQIIYPIKPEMTKKQRRAVKKLITPIVKRDSKTLVRKLIGQQKDIDPEIREVLEDEYWSLLD